MKKIGYKKMIIQNKRITKMGGVNPAPCPALLEGLDAACRSGPTDIFCLMQKMGLRYTLFSVIFFIFLSVQNTTFSEELASSHLSKGHQFYFQGLPELALEEYQKCLDIDPDNFTAYVNMGIIYRDLNLYQEAINSYNKALQIDKQAFLLCNLGWAYYNIGEFEKSENAFRDVFSITDATKNPSLICDTHFGLGSVYLQTKFYDKAEEELKKAIAINPSHAPAYFRLGMLYEKQDNVQEAIKNYTKVLEVDYNFVEVRFKLARLHLKEKQYEKAFKQYAKISNFDSQNIEAKTKKEEILALLAKKPEEIIPPKRILKNTSVSPASEREKIPLLRIGIGVDSQGKPLYKDTVYFKCGGDFIIIKKSTGTTIIQGKKDEIWTIKLKEQGFVIIDPQNNELGTYDEPVIIWALEPETNTIIIQNIGYGKGFPWGGEEDREYRGEIEISPSKKYGLQIINIVNIEEYLYSVLPSEMSTYWPMEALKAQAVIARGEALYKQKYTKPHTQDNYDLCDDQNCQVYRGIKNEDAKSIQAVNATRGEVLYYGDKIAHTLYSSNCGGHTQSSRELTGWGHEPYLEGILDGPSTTSVPDSPFKVEQWIKMKPDVYCNLPEFSYPAEFRWAIIIDAKDLEERINRTYDIGRLLGITPLKRSKSGHVNSILIQGEKKEIVLEKEHHIRRLFSAGFLRSNLFVIETRFDENNLPVELTIYGGGWGHGVGMCQTGAAGMAHKNGASYKQILKHYYKDTVLKKTDY